MVKLIISGLFAAATAAGLAACAAQPQQAPAGAAAAGQRQCFLARNVNGFRPIDDDTVHVTVGANTVYALGVTGMCHNIDWTHRIALRSTGGSSWICHGLDAELIVPGPTGPDRCLVTSIRRLTPEEAKAARGR